MSIDTDIEVIYVPWYLKANMDAIDLSLNELKNELLDITTEKKLSLMDLTDTKILNVILNKTFFNTINFKNSSFYEMLYTLLDKIPEDIRIKKEIEMINLLSNSSGYTEKNNTFTLMYDNNTVFVILNEGFTNFIKFNNQSDKEYLMKCLINFMFKHFKRADVYVSAYFKTFLSLKPKKTN